jgi:hypothetical protein
MKKEMKKETGIPKTPLALPPWASPLSLLRCPPLKKSRINGKCGREKK